jgi:hypothetical protein
LFLVPTPGEFYDPVMRELSTIESQMAVLLEALWKAEQFDAHATLEDMRKRLTNTNNVYARRLALAECEYADGAEAFRRKAHQWFARHGNVGSASQDGGSR